MKRNVAGQKIGAQMVSATDGSAFTGSVTVSVTLDAGTQATGSVGSGACTHEGNGYHTYAPAQAETNGDLAAFTFTGTGAVPATVQVYTSFPQTEDNATRLTDLQARVPAALTGDGNMKADTLRVGGTLQTARDIGASVLLSSGTGTGQLSLSSGLVALSGTQTFNVTGNITGNLSGSVGSVTGAVGSVTGAVGSVTGNVGGNVVGSVASVTAAVAITSNIKKNTASAGFTFVMTDSTNHNPAASLTITATRSIDGAAFGACANAAAEVSNGTYKIDLAAADVNGNHIMLRFTATGADDRFIEIITQP